MSKKNPILRSARSRVAGLLARAANTVEGSQSVAEPTDPPMNIHNFNPDGKAVVMDIREGAVSYKAMNAGQIDKNAGEYIREKVEKALLELSALNKHQGAHGIHTFIDHVHAQFAVIHFEQEYLSGEPFTKAVLSEISDCAKEYGYDIYIIGADRMKTFKVPERYIARLAGSEGSSVSAPGVVDHDRI